MSRFSMYDRVQQIQENAEAAQVDKDDWIRDKADELARDFPECAMEFYRPSLRMSPYRVGLDSDAAQDAYVIFVESVCLAKAKELYGEAKFMGDVA